MEQNRKGKCKRCGQTRYLLSGGLCTKCYKISITKTHCKICDSASYIVARGMCGNCYAFYLKGEDNYRKILLDSGREVKCEKCEERRLEMLDVHHKDFVHSNSDIKNLCFLCPNHHREIHLTKRAHTVESFGIMNS
jgi:hypothetical protein